MMTTRRSTPVDFADNTKKYLENTNSDLETAITEAKEGVVTLTDEIDALEDSTEDLDTEQRKDEHEEFTELMSGKAAATELLAFAKNF